MKSDSHRYPPPPNMQLSPDGNFAWDGSQWIPVQASTRAHAAAHHQPARKGLTSFAEESGLSTSEDLVFGQQVIVWARWILIGTGLVLSFWNAQALWVLQIQLAAIIALAFGNFYLHVQLLRGRPSIDAVVWGASLADLVVITALVIVQGGFNAPVFIFYFAAVLGFSVAFPTALTALYTAGAIVFYSLIASASATATGDSASVIFTRSLMIATVALCGNLFHRNESHRRAEALRARESMLDEVGGPAGAGPAPTA